MPFSTDWPRPSRPRPSWPQPGLRPGPLRSSLRGFFSWPRGPPRFAFFLECSTRFLSLPGAALCWMPPRGSGLVIFLVDETMEGAFASSPSSNDTFRRSCRSPCLTRQFSRIRCLFCCLGRVRLPLGLRPSNRRHVRPTRFRLPEMPALHHPCGRVGRTGEGDMVRSQVRVGPDSSALHRSLVQRSRR